MHVVHSVVGFAMGVDFGWFLPYAQKNVPGHRFQIEVDRKKWITMATALTKLVIMAKAAAGALKKHTQYHCLFKSIHE